MLGRGEQHLDAPADTRLNARTNEPTVALLRGVEIS
jgi:hypothetical protein